MVQLGRPGRGGHLPPRRRKRTVRSLDPDDARGGPRGRRPAGDRQRQRRGAQLRPGADDRADRVADPHGRCDRPALRRTGPGALPERDGHGHRDRRRTGALVAGRPEPLWARTVRPRGELLRGPGGAAPAELARRDAVPQRPAPAPARREHPGGRAGPRRRADRRRPGHDRLRAAGHRGQRGPQPASARPRPARTPRCGRDARLAGPRPRRRGRQLVLLDSSAAGCG